MLAIGNEELAKAETLGKTIKCPQCGKNHKVKYNGTITSRDGRTRPNDLLATYKCKGKLYLAGIAGKSLMKQ